MTSKSNFSSSLEALLIESKELENKCNQLHLSTLNPKPLSSPKINGEINNLEALIKMHVQNANSVVEIIEGKTISQQDSYIINDLWNDWRFALIRSENALSLANENLRSKSLLVNIGDMLSSIQSLIFGSLQLIGSKIQGLLPGTH